VRLRIIRNVSEQRRNDEKHAYNDTSIARCAAHKRWTQNRDYKLELFNTTSNFPQTTMQTSAHDFLPSLCLGILIAAVTWTCN